MNYKTILNNSYTKWLKDKKTINYVLIYFFINLFFTLIFFGLIYLFFQETVNNYFQLINLTASTSNQQVINELVKLTITSFLKELTPVLPLFILNEIVKWVFTFFVSVLMYSQAMKLKGFKSIPITLNTFLKTILLLIWSLILTITSFYSKKLFYFFIGLIFLIVLTIISFSLNKLIGLTLFFVLCFATLIYLIVIIYNSIRLSFNLPVFLSEEQSIIDATRKSWKVTKGKVIELFLAFFLLTISLIIIFSILNNAADSVINIIFHDNMFISIILDQTFRLVITPIIITISVFGLIEIYSETI